MIIIHAAHCNTEYVYVLATCNSTEKNSAWLTEQKLIIEYDFWIEVCEPLIPIL